MRSIVRVSLIFGIVSVTLVLAPAQSPPKGPKWVEPDELTEKGRLQQRPGNMHALTTVIQFIDGLYQLEPQVVNCAFPFAYLEFTAKNSTQLNDLLVRENTRGGVATNLRRKYIYEIKSTKIYDFSVDTEVARMRQLFEDKKIDPKGITDSHEAFKASADRSLCVVLLTQLHSLRSDKIEGLPDGAPWVFHCIRKDNKWLIALYSEH